MNIEKLKDTANLFAKNFYKEIIKSIEDLDKDLIANIALPLYQAKEEGKQEYLCGDYMIGALCPNKTKYWEPLKT